MICVKEFNEEKIAENLEKIIFKSLSDFGMLLTANASSITNQDEDFF